MRWHTKITLCCNPRFWHVLGAKLHGDPRFSKDNKSQWKEKLQKNTQLSFWLKAKSSSNKFAIEDFIFVVGSAANSELSTS